MTSFCAVEIISTHKELQGHFDFGAFDNGVGLGQMNIGVWNSDFEMSKVEWSL